MSHRPLWNVRQVAEYLNVTDRTVRTWQRFNKLPYLKIGGTVRFRPDEVVAWAEQFEEAAIRTT